MPIPSTNVLPIGFPYLEKKRRTYDHIEKREQLLIISQPAIATSLDDFVVDLATHVDDGLHIVYKPHPQDKRDVMYKDRLRGSGIEVVDLDADLYEPFARSTYQLGVFSTAIFEGLAFSCRTLIVDLPGAEFMTPLIEAERATLVQSPADVFTAMGESRGSALELFAPVEPSQINDFLSSLVINDLNL